MPTAVVVDGAFFLRRFASSFPDLDASNADDIALGLTSLASFHLAFRLTPNAMLSAIGRGFQPDESGHLYRILFYDCPPLTKRMHRPVSNRSINWATTDTAIFRNAVHARLETVRKVAVRRGRLNDEVTWRHKPEALKRWLANPAGDMSIDEDFELDVKQKGADMRLGLDVAAMAFKKQVDQIVLVAADADFVPAVKLARREGIDIVLDDMGHHAARDLVQHVDGVRRCRIPGRPGTRAVAAAVVNGEDQV